jgi:hypothetical protein
MIHYTIACTACAGITCGELLGELQSSFASHVDNPSWKEKLT